MIKEVKINDSICMAVLVNGFRIVFMFLFLAGYAPAGGLIAVTCFSFFNPHIMRSASCLFSANTVIH